MAYIRRGTAGKPTAEGKPTFGQYNFGDHSIYTLVLPTIVLSSRYLELGLTIDEMEASIKAWTRFRDQHE